MARPIKKGLDYFPFDVNSMHDIKILKLAKNCGAQAYMVYCTLLCMIYKDGYYIRWDKDLSFLISVNTFLTEDYVSLVIEHCFEYGLFDLGLFKSDKVLTSRGIQERYISAVASAKRKKLDDFPYSLFDRDKEATEGSRKPAVEEPRLPFAEENKISSEKTIVSSEEIPDEPELTVDDAGLLSYKSEETGVDSVESTQIKEKESKENENSSSSSSTCVREGVVVSSVSSDSLPSEVDAIHRFKDDVEKLKQADIWCESFLRNYKISKEKLTELLDTFREECIMRGCLEHGLENSIRKHFANWIARRLGDASSQNSVNNSHPIYQILNSQFNGYQRFKPASERIAEDLRGAEEYSRGMEARRQAALRSGVQEDVWTQTFGVQGQSQYVQSV